MRPIPKTFCVLPWIHRFTNIGGEIQVCCTSEEYNSSHVLDSNGAVMNAASGDARKVIADATSSGVARRPSGVMATIPSRWASVSWEVISVATPPGATTLTVIEREANSRAMERAIPIRPALDAA